MNLSLKKSGSFTANVFKAALLTTLCLGSSLATAATPKAAFGNALITGADNQIAVSRVPVVNSLGQVSYRDINISFDVAADGTINMAPFNPVITASPNLVTSVFKAGDYKDALGNIYSVTGPSVIPGTTRTAWSLAFVSGTGSKQYSMSWVTGSITGHPNQSSLTARSITTSAYSWGIAGASINSSTSFPFYGWANGTVIGAAQAGNQLTFHWFYDSNNIEDRSASLTYCGAAC